MLPIMTELIKSCSLHPSSTLKLSISVTSTINEGISNHSSTFAYVLDSIYLSDNVLCLSGRQLGLETEKLWYS